MRTAHQPNPALAHLDVLVGTWATTGSHPYVPGEVLTGRVVFEWIEGGAYLRMSSELDHPDFPSDVAVLGSDDGTGRIMMLYFDSRRVSRMYEFDMTSDRLKWWRDNDDLSQRFTVTIEPGGDRMVGKGEMSRSGAAWEGDLDLTYTRLDRDV